ncbi:hypothetical protein ACOMHN_043994 [Nucella lapillus]
MSRISSFHSRPPSRPPSEQLCDLHVYKVPWDLWREPLNNILNQAVTDTISLGIIRVHPEVPLVDLRDEIQKQLEDMAPKQYVFLRSVGRSLTRLKKKQEYQLKARDFLHPKYYAPELYLLEATQEMQDAFAASERSSQQSRSSMQQGSPGGRSYRNGYRSDRDRNGYPGWSFMNGYPGRDRWQFSYRPVRCSSNPDRAESVMCSDLHRALSVSLCPPSGNRHSRQRREPARRDSPHQYSPLPRINPTTPTQSREGSPSASFFLYSHDGQPPLSGPEDFADTNPNPNPYQSHTKYPHREEGNKRREERYPPDPYRSYKENPQTLQAEGRARQVASDGRAENSDYVPPPLDPSSPRQSPERSRARKGHGAGTYRAANGYDCDAAYTNHTNEDSGVAGLTPEDQYKNRDKENYYDANSKARDLQNRLNRNQFNSDDDEEQRRRLRDMDEGALMDSERWAKDQDERRRRAEEERLREEEERRKEEEQRKAEEEEEKRRKEKEEEEEERRRRQEEARLKVSDEDLNRFPSPPPLRMSSSDVDRDTESAQQRRREEKQKLLSEIEKAQESRQMTEKEREDLVKRAKTLQMKTQNRRNQARDIWKKRYFEEKKKTPPLEEQTNRLKEELDALHRKLMAVLEGPKEKNVKLGDNRPSQKNNYVIQCTRLQHDIEDLKRRIENAKMKLTAEMKLRNQAETELRSLRAELVQKKINLSLVRTQQFAALTTGLSEATPVPDIPPGKRDEQSVTA